MIRNIGIKEEQRSDLEDRLKKELMNLVTEWLWKS